jgi:diguanylate cyclase (GGDEF)-like protein/PAS domain S-box-containing protein
MNAKQLLDHSWGRSGLAIVLVALASIARLWPLQALDSAHLWLTFYPAVVVTAIYAGRSAGWLATALACLAAALPWPVGRPIETAADVLGMAVFALCCTMICGLIDAMRRARARADAARELAESAAQASARSAQFIRSLVDAIPNMIGYWRQDLHFGFANTAYVEWHGKDPQSIIGTPIRNLMGERLFALNEPYIRRALAGEVQHFQRTLTKADGRIGHILASYIPDLDAQGAVRGIFIHASDVTELKEAQAQLELAASVFDNTVDGVAVTDADGVFLSVNPAFTTITGYTAAEAIGQTPRLLKSQRHDKSFYVAMWQALASHGQWKGDLWNRRKNGEIYPERITISKIRGAAGEAARYVAVFSDITALWRQDEYLKHLAFHDALTNLPNRALLMELLGHQITVARREQTGLALMFLDLDRFKSVNDRFGHDVGDELLQTVANRLQALVRQSDTVARLGGDEFVIKLDNPADRDEIARIAGRVIASINEPMEFRGQSVQVGTSIGIAVFPGGGQTPAELIKNADSAMYAAKNSGKNAYRFFAPTMSASAGERPRATGGDDGSAEPAER